MVTEDASGTIWIGTANGLARFDGDRWTPLTDGGAPAGEVMNIHHDLRGVVWVTLGGLGVRRFDGEWQAYTQNEGLEDNRVRNILEDDEGFLWFGGGFGGRVSRFDDTSVLTMTESDGLPHSHVTSLAQDRQGRIWIGTVAGLATYDGTTFSHVGSEQGLVSDRINDLMIDGNERVWIGTRDGLSRWDGSVFETMSREEGLIFPTARMALHEDSKGAVWIGAGGAILRYIGGSWTDTGADAWATAFTPDRDGVLYAVTGRGVIQYKENRWTEYEDDRLLAVIFRDIKGDRRDNLWLGTYGDGIWRIGTDSVEHYDVGEETGDRFINRILEDRSGVLWFGSGGAFVVGSGIARYDGKVFQTLTTDDGLAHNNIEAFLEDRNGDIWIGTEQGLTRYRKPKASPPPVQIEAILANGRRQDTESASISADVVTIEYDAASIKTRPEAMVFRYRLLGHDDDWQNTRSRRVEYADLPWGDYTFEVLAVDRDLVYSQSPASVALTILPPYSRIAWMTAAGIFLIAAAWQTTRVIQRDRRLRQSNEALSDANNELYEVNQTLHRDSAVQRIRAEIQSMDKTEDFDRVLSFMMTDLKQVGLTFSTCEIDVLDEPVEDPSMEHFVADGFRYTTFRLEPSGDVSSDSYNLAAPFPAMNQRTIERFIAGEPWQGMSEGEAIVEVPAGSYGRLRLTATDRDSFTEDEVATLREFAAAIALGYARYLDIREIQLQTERKSAFLASMSHELRTPMNAIKGFTNLVLRRGRDELSDRNQENLQKVDQASDHLLAMIDDLLDLSKIEAGRMDVNVESFDIAELVKSCCDTVSPLVKEGVELRHRIEGEIGGAHTDRARLHQMVINLLSNAIKFTDVGSVVVTARSKQGEVSREKGNQATISPASPADGSRPTDNGDLVIAVTDTGQGIPEDEIATLFDEYRQVSGQSDSDVQKGTGLGLSITKKFAELLGGSIAVESEIGKSTTFTITIPSTYDS